MKVWTHIRVGNATKKKRMFAADDTDFNVLGIETMDLFDLQSSSINNLVSAVTPRLGDSMVHLKRQFPVHVFQSALDR